MLSLFLTVCSLACMAQTEVAPTPTPAPAAAPAAATPAPAAPAKGPEAFSDDLMQKIQAVNLQMQKDKETPAVLPEARAQEATAGESAAGPEQSGAAADPVASFPWYALKSAAALCIVLGLILLLTYLFKRFGKNAGVAAGSLGRPLGRIYLGPKTALHFVQTGGKVLVVGATPNAIALVASFDAATFLAHLEQESTGGEGAAGAAGGPFLSELQTTLRDISKKTAALTDDDDRDLAALRNEVQRLQRDVQESTGGNTD